MNKFKNQVLKLAISGVAIFAFGIFVGYELKGGALASIQGYLFNAAGEATDANASDANASDSNATNANASDANATDANATSTDNIIYLQYFSLGSTDAKLGDKVNVSLITTGACNSAASIVFKSITGVTFTAQVQDITGNPYIIIPSNALVGSYSVSDVLLVGKNSDNTTFTKQYSKNGLNSYNFESNLTITQENTVTQVALNSISFETTQAKINDKVYFNVEANEKVTSLKLVFTSSLGKTFTVYAKDLDSTRPYIEIPSTVSSGTYELTSSIVFGSRSSESYSKTGENNTKVFNFNTTLEISDGTTSNYIYNNEDITSAIITNLYNAPSGTEITINADSNTFIDKELFNAIKGNDKKLIINHNDNQMVFNGNDITDSKTIDINMSVSNVNSSASISKLVSNGVVVNFPDNGNLPGQALIRIKASDDIANILNDNVYVYVYNESSNDFCVIDLNAKKSSDGYYEFVITHNSSYLMVNEKLDSKLVVKESSDNTVSFQKSNKTLLLLIGIGVIVIIGAIVVIFLAMKKKKGAAEPEFNPVNPVPNPVNTITNNNAVNPEVNNPQVMPSNPVTPNNPVINNNPINPSEAPITNPVPPVATPNPLENNQGPIVGENNTNSSINNPPTNPNL